VPGYVQVKFFVEEFYYSLKRVKCIINRSVKSRMAHRFIVIRGQGYGEMDDYTLAIEDHQSRIKYFEEIVEDLKARVETLKAGKSESYIFSNPSVYDKYLEGIKLQREVDEKRRAQSTPRKDNGLARGVCEEPLTRDDGASNTEQRIIRRTVGEALDKLKRLWPEVLRCYEYVKQNGAGGDFGISGLGFSWNTGTIVRYFLPQANMEISPLDVEKGLPGFIVMLTDMEQYITRIHRFHHDNLVAIHHRLYLHPCKYEGCRGFISDGKTKCGVKFGWNVDYLNDVRLDDMQPSGKVFFMDQVEYH
jgi:hypothetical protein